MLKGKQKIPDKPRKVFPDMLGSLVAGFDLREPENAGSLVSSESGEELKAFEPNGLGSVEPVAMSDTDDEKPKGVDLDIRSRLLRSVRDGHGQISAMDVISADDKRSNLEYEVIDAVSGQYSFFAQYFFPIVDLEAIIQTDIYYRQDF